MVDFISDEEYEQLNIYNKRHYKWCELNGLYCLMETKCFKCGRIFEDLVKIK